MPYALQPECDGQSFLAFPTQPFLRHELSSPLGTRAHPLLELVRWQLLRPVASPGATRARAALLVPCDRSSFAGREGGVPLRELPNHRVGPAPCEPTGGLPSGFR